MKYTESWDSLKKHRIPDWFYDTKFGMYIHWGPYSVPSFGSEWYPFKMYSRIFREYRFHKKNYGHPREFGYKDFIPMFRGENFDPDDIADLFEEAGADFAGTVAEHHDGFSMWNSKINPWNAYRTGPHRDVVGELERAIRKRGMKFICTFHHAFNWYYYYHSPEYDTGRPEYRALYGPPHKFGPERGWSNFKYDRPSDEFAEIWFRKICEVIDTYRPDILWFDFGLKWIPDPYKSKMIAYYFNKAEEWGKETVIIYKYNDIPPNIGVVDYERGCPERLLYNPWVTDTSICNESGSYIEGGTYKSVNELIGMFADIISKNGRLLLNIGPKPDGTIPSEIKNTLADFGKWKRLYDEAITGSNPWVIYGEGKRRKKSGEFSEKRNLKFGKKDIRFTVRGNYLYILFTYPIISGIGGKKIRIKIRTFRRSARFRKIPISCREFFITRQAEITEAILIHPEGDYPVNIIMTNNGMVLEIDTEAIPPYDKPPIIKLQLKR